MGLVQPQHAIEEIRETSRIATEKRSPELVRSGDRLIDERLP
jgi:hypothetical protein